jgi:Spy/CpxP family protein refolding chaperone
MRGATGKDEKSSVRRNVAILALAGAVVFLGWYGWSRMAPYRRGLTAPEQQTAASQPQFGPPSPEEREQRMAEMMGQLDLTEQQKKQIEALGTPEPGTGSGSGQRREQMARILTPEQMAKFDGGRSQRMQQKLGESKRYLSPQDYQTMKERMERRKQQGGEFRGGGGGGGQGKKAP